MLRTVGTVIAAVLIAVAMLAVVGFFYYLLSSMTEFYQQLAAVLEEKTGAPLLASSVSGWWRQTGTTLHIHLENGNPTAILVTAVTILWDDDTTTVYDRNNATAPVFSATVTASDGTTSTTYTLPIALGVSYTADIYIDTGGKTTDKVYVTISASPVVAVIPLKSYYELYPNATAVAANATALGSPASRLPAACYDWTRAWIGTVTASDLYQALGTVYNAVSEAGSASGAAADLQAVDGAVYTLTQTTPVTVIDFTVERDNLIYAQDFSSDVFASGEWTTSGGDWRWGSTYGSTDGGIYQASRTTRQTVSGEYVAYPAAENIAASPFYILGHLSISSGEYADIVLYENDSSMITASLYYDGTYYYAEIYVYNASGWVHVNSSAPTDGAIWNIMDVYYDPDTGFINVSLRYADTGEAYAYTTGYDHSVAPRYAGFGTYRTRAYFDNLVVSLADPAFMAFSVYYQGAPAPDGWTVEVESPVTGNTYTGTVSSGVARVPVPREPIIPGAVVRVYDAGGGLVAELNVTDYGVSTLYGGNVYRVSIDQYYAVSLRVNSVVDTAASIYRVGAVLYLEANASGTYRVYIYNWDTGTWTPAGSGTVAAGSTVSGTLWAPPGASYYNADNGSVLIRLQYLATQPVQVTLDQLNAVYQYLVSSTFRAVLVACAPTTRILVLKDEGGGNLTYLYSIDAHTRLGPDTAIASDGTYLYLINATGVYRTAIGPLAAWEPLATACGSLGPNAALEALPGGSLLALRGGGDSYCVIDAATGTVTDTGTISAAVGDSIVLDPALVYTATAATGTDAAAVVALDNTTGQPVLLNATITGGAAQWSIEATLPTARPVGLAWNGTSLWLLAARGPLYIVTNGAVTTVNATLAFTPWGPGDRLLAYDTALNQALFIRADGTTETWLIPVPR